MPLRGDPKIALVHDWLTVPGGAEEVLREIYDLFPGTIFCTQFDKQRFPYLESADVRTTWLQHLPGSLKKHYAYAPLMPLAMSRLDLSGFDLVLSDSHSFAHFAHKQRDALHICYYHTPARSLWVPEIDGRASSSLSRRLLAKPLKRADLKASRNPDVCLANSKTTAERIRKFYGREVQHVVYPPVDTLKWAEVRRAGSTGGLICWGRLVPYKRIDLAIEAAKLADEKLHIVGDGPDRADLERSVAGDNRIRFHGRLPDADLAELLSSCRAAVFPGYEDFGIVPVEAMSAGVPVIAYGAGGVSESVTKELGTLFGQQTPESLADAIVASRELQPSPENLREQASKFDRKVFREQYSNAVSAAWEAHLDKRQTHRLD